MGLKRLFPKNLTIRGTVLGNIGNSLKELYFLREYRNFVSKIK